MIRKHNNPIYGYIFGLSGFLLTVWLVWNWQPDKWYKEAAVLLLGFGSMTVIGSQLFKNTKSGLLIVTGIFGLLIFNRLGILDWFSAILLLVVLGLITLVN